MSKDPLAIIEGVIRVASEARQAGIDEGRQEAAKEHARMVRNLADGLSIGSSATVAHVRRRLMKLEEKIATSVQKLHFASAADRVRQWALDVDGETLQSPQMILDGLEELAQAIEKSAEVSNG